MRTLDFTEPVAVAARDEPEPTQRTMALIPGDNGECEFKFGTFEWSDDGGRNWTGSPAVVDVDELAGRMMLGGPYKAGRKYRVVEQAKAKLVIDPCCSSCGIPGDISKPMVVEAQHCDHEPGTYSTFFGASIGQAIHACDYVIDPTVENAGHAVPAGFTANAYDQIVAAQGQFCSVFCLAMELFLNRNRRCAGCAKRLAKDEWISPEDSQAKTYPKYKYCSKPCEKRGHDFTTPHVMEVLGIVIKPPAKKAPARRERGAKMAKALVWQKAA